MKKILAFVFISLFGVSAVSAQAPFLRSYGGLGSDYGRAIIECSTGGYLVVGSTNSYYESDTDIYLLRLDVNGDYMWGRNIGTTNKIDWGIDLKESSDGSFFIAGYSDANSGNSYDGLLSKVDADGNELWRKYYGGPDWDFISNMAITATDEVIMVGQKSVEGALFGWIVKTDSAGDQIWEKTYSGSGMMRLTGVDVCADGRITLVGYNENTLLDSKTQITGVLESNGNTDWMAGYDEFGSMTTENCVCGNANNILTTGTKHIENNKINFSSIDIDNGSIIWTNQINSDLEAKAGAINQLPSGDVLLGASRIIGFDFEELDAVAYKYDENGEWISPDFADVFGGYGYDEVHDIIPTSDGGYTLVGETDSFENNSQIMVIHIAANGDAVVENEDFLDIATNLSQAERAKQAGFKLYPNPATDLLSLKIPSNNKLKSISIHSISCQAVFSETPSIKNGNIQMDIAMLPAGMYFVMVENLKGNIYHFPFIKAN